MLPAVQRRLFVHPVRPHRASSRTACRRWDVSTNWDAAIYLGGAHDHVTVQLNTISNTNTAIYDNCGLTHHYRHDVPVLRGLLPLRLGYLGLLGPKKRSERILEDLARDGLAVTQAMRTRLHAPVGLDLGADAPEEVALSIIAEMKAELSGRDARPLRERLRPIHG